MSAWYGNSPTVVVIGKGGPKCKCDISDLLPTVNYSTVRIEEVVNYFQSAHLSLYS